jgi:hypothetical protein
MWWAWNAALLFIAIYVIWQSLRDWQNRNYLAVAAGALCALLLALIPIGGFK